jgi:hypothetical protein
METKARFTVDADHCQRAAEELYQVFRVQHRGFVERWNAARTTRVVIGVARWVGLLLSLLGLFGVGALLYFDTREWASQPSAWFIPVFILFVLFFLFTSRVVGSLQRWSFRRADKNARRQADRCLKQARRLAPYEAEFDFRGDLLIYLRGKEGAWNLAWSRPLGTFRQRGMAVQGENVTVIFKRPRSLNAAVVILQRDRDWTASILQDAGITLGPFPLPDQRNP